MSPSIEKETIPVGDGGVRQRIADEFSVSATAGERHVPKLHQLKFEESKLVPIIVTQVPPRFEAEVGTIDTTERKNANAN